jgi:hypothetical protein
VDREAVSRRWNAIVAPGDEKHLRAGVSVRWIRKLPAVVEYLAKDEQKQLPLGFERMGRWWGHFGGLRADPVMTLQGSTQELANPVRLIRKIEASRRRMRNRPPRRDNGRFGFTVYRLSRPIRHCLARLLEESTGSQVGELTRPIDGAAADPARSHPRLRTVPPVEVPQEAGEGFGTDPVSASDRPPPTALAAADQAES